VWPLPAGESDGEAAHVAPSREEPMRRREMA
jgi:hypothetical protein